MTQPDPASMAKPSRAVRAEAAAWIARLHGSDRTVADEEGFRRWLAADAAHASAFERMTELWETGTRLKSDALTRLKGRLEKHSEFSWRLPRLAWGICGIAAVAIAAMFWRLSDDAVATRVGEQRTLTLEDGTRVTLNTATRLALRYSREQRHIELQSGEALFEVIKQTDRPFVVTAGARQITALGTAFIVRREPKQLSITLVEGKVGVSASGLGVTAQIAEPVTILTPGQRLTVSLDRLPTIDRPAIEKVTAWRQGVIAMDKMPLSVAVAEMNRYSEVPLVIKGLDAAGMQVSGVFKAGDSLEFAHALARSHGLNAEESSDEIILSGQLAR